MSATVLSLRGATKRFGGLVAVNGMDFDVAEHEVMGLIGPNGSGKSTTLNLISGALKPTAGSISLRGHGNRRPRAAGHQPQGRRPDLSAGAPAAVDERAGKRNGRRGLRPSSQLGPCGARQGHGVAGSVGLSRPGDSRVGQLTYIDTKRVELARVLACDPRILLLDEWLAGLNPTELETGIRLIRSLRDEGRTIILVEHVMDAIRSLCDRCVVMSSGTKIAEGTPTRSCRRRGHPRLPGDDDA
jgi:branched-chain amino acid transport system ATP-binding protein